MVNLLRHGIVKGDGFNIWLPFKAWSNSAIWHRKMSHTVKTILSHETYFFNCASIEEAKQLYKKLAMLYHPEKIRRLADSVAN